MVNRYTPDHALLPGKLEERKREARQKKAAYLNRPYVVDNQEAKEWASVSWKYKYQRKTKSFADFGQLCIVTRDNPIFVYRDKWGIRHKEVLDESVERLKWEIQQWENNSQMTR